LQVEYSKKGRLAMIKQMRAGVECSCVSVAFDCPCGTAQLCLCGCHSSYAISSNKAVTAPVRALKLSLHYFDTGTRQSRAPPCNWLIRTWSARQLYGKRAHRRKHQNYYCSEAHPKGNKDGLPNAIGVCHLLTDESSV
jgi:hypothetical protein